MPSPEMIAAAGTERFTVAGCRRPGSPARAAGHGDGARRQSELLARIPCRAAPVLRIAPIKPQSFGYTEPVVDTVSSFTYDQSYLRWASAHGSAEARWPELPTGRPAALRFVYRTSPVPLVPRNYLGPVTTSDPPVQINGMTYLTLDSMGQLLRFEAAPAQIEPEGPTPASVDWDKVFAAAGLSRGDFSETRPGRTPPTFAGERHAWQGKLPGPRSMCTSRRPAIEAARSSSTSSRRGRPRLAKCRVRTTARAAAPFSSW
jgi:hypothetical protein